MFDQHAEIHTANLVLPVHALEGLGINVTGRKTFVRAILTPHAGSYAAEFFHTTNPEHKEEFDGCLTVGVVAGEVFEIVTTDMEGGDRQCAALVLTHNVGLMPIPQDGAERYQGYVAENEAVAAMEFEVPTLSEEETTHKIQIIKNYQAEVAMQQEAIQSLQQAEAQAEAEETPVKKGPTLVS